MFSEQILPEEKPPTRGYQAAKKRLILEISPVEKLSGYRIEYIRWLSS
jgi:hypothetical protein